MDSLLIGAAIDGAFLALHDKLRSSTIDFSCKKYGQIIRSYSPWLCIAPILPVLDSDLIYFVPAVRGSLVTDEEILQSMARFLIKDGHPTIADLPGEPSSWLPSQQNISSNYNDAVAIIRNADAVMRLLFDVTVDYVVPLGGGRNRGYSTHLARGAIFRSLPKDNDRYDVAIDIVHEVGHQVLMAWQSIDTIIASDPTAPVFSEIRRVDRPAIQTFHATVALAFMRYFEKTLSDDIGLQAAARRRGATYSGTLSNSLALSISSIRKVCQLTELGQKLLDEMEVLI